MVDTGLNKLNFQTSFGLIFIPMSAGMVGSIALTFLKGATTAQEEVGFTGGFSLYVYAFIALASG